MKMLVGATVTAAALALPQGVAACDQLSANVWMCAKGTPWAAAEWDPYGDGATLLLDDLVLNFTEDWPGAEIRDDLSTLREQFVTYAELVEADGNPPLEVKEQSELDIPAGKAFRSLQRDRYDDLETVSAVMLAQVDVARIMLWLDGPRTMSWDDMDAASREVLETLRNICADPDDCAAPNQERVESE
ncbi:hypothetical protein AB2B41_20020 [Marimonas sp. MJW-29]|uniref:Uncharacterized protein n=1 Tax=Sulfitobacter sediminis TaxID=3234186 RepID=A0ABV3RTS3_9RHOB